MSLNVLGSLKGGWGGIISDSCDLRHCPEQTSVISLGNFWDFARGFGCDPGGVCHEGQVYRLVLPCERTGSSFQDDLAYKPLGKGIIRR